MKKDEGTVEYSTDVRWFKKLKATDLDYKAKEATKNICYEKRWRYSWIQYRCQMVQEIEGLRFRS